MENTDRIVQEINPEYGPDNALQNDLLDVPRWALPTRMSTLADEKITAEAKTAGLVLPRNALHFILFYTKYGRTLIFHLYKYKDAHRVQETKRMDVNTWYTFRESVSIGNWLTLLNRIQSGSSVSTCYLASPVCSWRRQEWSLSA
ncbi:hypothetical protein Y032_0056g2635 [Ancylostoma ceylanicum]|uniref:Uncharacterized protein n=1 Tax=Ancylostoma ceylanicum TaxID=53326 RepID=A0A016U5M3_9BILA|nr:hypothetical protein Y032_0056g2635 [Ancylostoma ceylanicum]